MKASRLGGPWREASASRCLERTASNERLSFRVHGFDSKEVQVSSHMGYMGSRSSVSEASFRGLHV